MGIRKQYTSWEHIYQDFLKRNSAIKDKIVKWEPYNWLTIKITLSDGRMLLYDYSSATTEFLGTRFL